MKKKNNTVLKIFLLRVKLEIQRNSQICKGNTQVYKGSIIKCILQYS